MNRFLFCLLILCVVTAVCSASPLVTLVADSSSVVTDHTATITASVKESNGSTYSNVPVHFEVHNGTLSDSQKTTDESGACSVTVTAPSIPGCIKILAKALIPILSGSDVVYVTHNDERYHRHGCPELKGHTAFPIPISEIGNHTPCKVCKPDATIQRSAMICLICRDASKPKVQLPDSNKTSYHVPADHNTIWGVIGLPNQGLIEVGKHTTLEVHAFFIGEGKVSSVSLRVNGKECAPIKSDDTYLFEWIPEVEGDNYVEAKIIGEAKSGDKSYWIAHRVFVAVTDPTKSFTPSVNSDQAVKRAVLIPGETANGFLQGYGSWFIVQPMNTDNFSITLASPDNLSALVGTTSNAYVGSLGNLQTLQVKNLHGAPLVVLIYSNNSTLTNATFSLATSVD